MSEKDFYSEDVNFSDDPEDSFYSTSPKKKSKGLQKELVWGFQWWEIVVLVGWILLLIYIVLVLLGMLPLL